MSRFPTIRETFILYEMLELQQRGVQIDVFPLIQQRESVVHPEVARLDGHVHYARLCSWQTLADQFYWLRRHPLRYLGAWGKALRGTVFSFDFFLRAFVVVPLAARFARQIRDLHIDHMHAHWATHPALAAFVVHHLTGTPYSFTAHAHDIYMDRTMLAEKMQHASFVVTISRYNQDMLQALYGDATSHHVRVIHCGVDLSVFQPRDAASHTNNANTASDDTLTIVCVAGLEERKGHRYLIEACAALQREGVPFRCVLVGEGPERPAIEAAIKQHGVQEHVVLEGYQPRDRVRELLAGASVVVLPSITTQHNKKEGIPVTLMEALAMAVPVISTQQSGIPELITHEQSGLLVPERDTDSLVDALVRCYLDPAWAAQLGQAGRAHVEREFDLQKETGKLYGLLVAAATPHQTPQEEEQQTG